MFDLLNRFWIAMPLSYAMTAGGLLAGFRRGGMSERRVSRALVVGIPVVVGALIAWNIIVGLVEPPGVHGQFRGLELVLGLMFIACSSALAGSVLAHRRSADAVERGTMLVREGVRGSLSAGPGELTLAGHPIALMDETKHFKIIGTTGTGKSTAIRELMTGALSRGDRAVIADPDGGYVDLFYDPARGDVILNPFDARAARWDLFAEIVKPHDADQLARSLIPDHDGPDRYWRNFARTFLTAVLRQLQRVDGHSVAQLYATIVTATIEDLKELLDSTAAAPFLGKDGGKFFESVRSITIQHLTALEHLARQADGEAFSVRKWIQEGRGVLFLPYQASEIASLRHVISTWMRLAIFEAMNGKEGDRRLWFVVDELDALGAIDGLKDALARLRKFGGRCALGFQSIGQVRGTYGDTEAQTIVENCGNTLILRCSASERGGTAEFASRLIGKREVLRKQYSVSRPRTLFGFLRQTRAVTDQVATEDAVMASEIEQLPDLSGFLKRASRPEWQRVRLGRGESHPAGPQRFGPEASLVGVIGAVIVTLALGTRLFGEPNASDHTRADASTISKSTSRHLSQSSLPAEISRLLPPETLSSQGPHATARSARHPSQPSDPHEVIIGPNTIRGRFILLASNRRHTGPTSDELTLRLRVVSLAVADLVTPYQSGMLEVQVPGQAPIPPRDSFSHPVAAHNSREDEITFVVPSTLDLDHSTLNISYFNEAKAIPLALVRQPHQR